MKTKREEILEDALRGLLGWVSENCDKGWNSVTTPDQVVQAAYVLFYDETKPMQGGCCGPSCCPIDIEG